MSKKLILKQKEAIADCKLLWKFVSEGEAKNKYDALSLVEPAFLIRYPHSLHCPLCSYSQQFNRRNCSKCPYVKKYHTDCMDKKCSYDFTPIEFAKRVMDL